MLVGSQLAPVVFQFFSFSVLMPVHCGKPDRVCFLYISIWIAPKCSIMCVQKFTITFSSLCLHFVRVLCLAQLAVRTQRKLAALLLIAALTSSTFMVC